MIGKDVSTMTDHEIIAAQLKQLNDVEHENQQLRQRLREEEIDRIVILGRLRAVEKERDRLLVIMGRTAARSLEV
jgi:cell shape-determining protein MreC